MLYYFKNNSKIQNIMKIFKNKTSARIISAVLFFVFICIFPSDAAAKYECNLEKLKDDVMPAVSQGRFKDTADMYSACIEKYPDKKYLYNNRANAYKMMKEFNKALADYNKAIELDKNYLSPYNGKTSLYLMQGRISEALMTADEILKINPKYAGAYNNKGSIYLYKNDIENALKNYKYAVTYEPENYYPAYYYIGGIYYGMGKYKEAVQNYEQCVKYYKNYDKDNVLYSDFSTADLHYNLGMAYYKLKNSKYAFLNILRAARLYGQAGRENDENDTLEFIKSHFDLNETEKYFE